MSKFSDTRYPKTVFNPIKGKKVKKNEQRNDLYEFKSKHLRVYVVLQKPNVFVVMGGSKNTQDTDPAALHKRLKGFPTQLDISDSAYLEEEYAQDLVEKEVNEEAVLEGSEQS